jgi:hypothetical protein
MGPPPEAHMHFGPWRLLDITDCFRGALDVCGFHPSLLRISRGASLRHKSHKSKCFIVPSFQWEDQPRITKETITDDGDRRWSAGENKGTNERMRALPIAWDRFWWLATVFPCEGGHFLSRIDSDRNQSRSSLRREHSNAVALESGF